MNIIPAVFQSNQVPNNEIKRLNSLYEFFCEVWESTYAALNSPPPDLGDEFCRFDTKVGLFIGEQAVAFHGYGKFNLNFLPDRDHSYFRKLGVPLVENFLSRGLTQIGTYEYMAVHPQYRKVANQYLGEILAAFSAQYFMNSSLDALVTTARLDRGVDKICQLHGGVAAFKNVSMNNAKVDIMVFEPVKLKPSPKPEIHNLVLELIERAKIQNKMRAA